MPEIFKTQSKTPTANVPWQVSFLDLLKDDRDEYVDAIQSMAIVISKSLTSTIFDEPPPINCQTIKISFQDADGEQLQERLLDVSSHSSLIVQGVKDDDDPMGVGDLAVVTGSESNDSPIYNFAVKDGIASKDYFITLTATTKRGRIYPRTVKQEVRA